MTQFLTGCRRYALDAAMITGMVVSALVLAVTIYASYHAGR